MAFILIVSCGKIGDEKGVAGTESKEVVLVRDSTAEPTAEPSREQSLEPAVEQVLEPAVDRLSEQTLYGEAEMTEEELRSIVEELPPSIREGILKRPDNFIHLLERVLEKPEELLTLVDKSHSLPKTYVPEDLVYLREYPLTINKHNLQLREIVLDDLLAMNDAAKIDGVELTLSSTYRSYEYQERVFAYNIEKLGVEQAKRESAQPGKSQHQLGTTIDFGSITPEFALTEQGKWLKEHAWEFGFSLSYPEDAEDITGYIHECWHFRYITREGTKLEREFFLGMQQYMLVFLDNVRDELRQLYSGI